MDKKVTLGEFFKIEWRVFRELITNHRSYTIAIILLYNISTIIALVELKFLQFITTQVSNIFVYSAYDSIIFWGSMIFLGILLGLKVLDGLFYTISDKYDDVVNSRIKEQLVNKISSISYEYFEHKDTYEKICIANKGVETYTNAVYGTMKIIKLVFLLIMYCVLLSQVGVLFTLLLIISVFLCTLLCGKVSDYQLDYWRKKVLPKTRRNSYFKNVINNRINQQNIQTQGSYTYFAEKAKIYNCEERHSYMRLNMLTEISEITGSILFMISFFCVAIFLGRKVINGECEIGYFTMIVALLGSMFDNLKNFTIFMLNNNEFIRDISEYYSILDMNNIQNKLSTTSADNNLITCESLYYSYPQAQSNALNGISLKIKRGEKIAIVGKNGSGKTTMMSIFMGLINSFQGYYRNSSKCCIAVLQDFIEYNFTIKENIEIGCGGEVISEDEIYDILKKIDLYDYVIKLKNGIYTKLGELDDGIELSKGQWQRIAIGRLLANKNADLWILDEPAAYLDPISEIEIYKLIFSLAEDRTVLFTSHRLGFAHYANRILVIDNGIIVENGSHDDLICKNGLYSQMFDIQRKWYS